MRQAPCSLRRSFVWPMAVGFVRSPRHLGRTSSRPELPGHLRRLGGEFFCLPFGGGGAVREPGPGWKDLAKGPVNQPMHGPATNHDWTIVEYRGNAVTFALDDIFTSPIKHVERRITLAPDRPRVDITISIEMRRQVRLPIAFHPILRLPRNSSQLTDIDFTGLTSGCRQRMIVSTSRLLRRCAVHRRGFCA